MDNLEPQDLSGDEEIAHRLYYLDIIRDRGLDAYSEFFGLDIRGMALDSARSGRVFTWYDMCCGDFGAGQDLYYGIRQSNDYQLAPLIQPIGIDLVTPTAEDFPTFGATIRRGNAIYAAIPGDTQLLTCVQGLYYIERYYGKGVEAIANWFNQLSPGAIMAFDYPENLDPEFLEYMETNLAGSIQINRHSTINGVLNIVTIVKPEGFVMQI
jgi:hypothetical protein